MDKVRGHGRGDKAADRPLCSCRCANQESPRSSPFQQNCLDDNRQQPIPQPVSLGMSDAPPYDSPHTAAVDPAEDRLRTQQAGPNTSVTLPPLTKHVGPAQGVLTTITQPSGLFMRKQ
jgi:hypothetical protein